MSAEPVTPPPSGGAPSDPAPTEHAPTEHAPAGHAVRRSYLDPEVFVGEAGSMPVKVWQPWIRTVHWTIVASVVVLSVTGLYIGDPVGLSGLDVPIMAWSHDVHVFAGWMLIAALIGRLFLLFTGNPWARWDELVPVRAERRRQLVHTLRYYMFLEHEPSEVVGHNPMAGLSYLGVYGAFALQGVTGLLFIAAQKREGLLWSWVGWMTHVLPLPTWRLIHHIIMWAVWLFVIIHLYAATLTDRVEHGGEVSSMIGGWKILPRTRVRQDLLDYTGRRDRRTV